MSPMCKWLVHPKDEVTFRSVGYCWSTPTIVLAILRGEAYPWDVGYGIIRTPIAVLLPLHLQKDAVMSLPPQPIAPVPEQTAQIAHAAFPKGNPYLTLRDQLPAFSANNLPAHARETGRKSSP